ncbi:conserved hypothetical protein [Pseudomonas sp. OF001]|uniref:hypothetical protein n=1 Tax=unclassified Pseudomonas TaxID=196821 RepID=UPI001984D2E8|nr:MULTISPECIES: hypothetical protein [unclassified Pseudomonas]WPP46095.1 hypothetical protein SK095_01490 [Pseudomonas sp. AN-1]CAD5379135.1 conserved hypothetical protein [Pseudomonas sp. OF001]
MADPLSDAVDRFREVSTYQVTVRSVAADGERQVIRYFYRKPGWVRMEFVQPHSGAVLIYDPDARKVRLWPFGLKHTLVLTLDSDNPLVRSARGHRVDRSDVGALLENLLTLRARGQAVALGEAVVAGRPTVGVDIIGAAGVTVAGVHRYQVWLAQDTLFPLRVKSFEVGGILIETVDMTDVATGMRFDERFFTP